jgi:putative DNA primase/helicase
MATERSSSPIGPPSAAAAPRRAAARGESPRPPVDRLTVGKLLNHGRAPHEFHARGHPSYFVRILTDDGERTIWGRGLERALAKSRTQPQVGDAIGIRENNLAPVSFITRTRNAEGLVVATRQTDTPRPHWVIEKLEDFDLRAAAARALRDPTLSRREAVTNHRELGPAYWILDAAQKYATGRWESEKTRDTFVAAVRETLALTVERGIELPEAARESARSAVVPNGLQRQAARTRE